MTDAQLVEACVVVGRLAARLDETERILRAWLAWEDSMEGWDEYTKLLAAAERACCETCRHAPTQIIDGVAYPVKCIKHDQEDT